MTPSPDKGEGTRYPGIYRLEDGRFRVTKTWIDERTGRRVYREKMVSGTLDDAQRERAGLRAAEQSAPERQRPRFADFATRWLERHKKKLQPSTAERYTRDVAHLIVEFGEWWVDAIDCDGIELWQDEVVDEYKAPTVNGWHRTLRLVLDRAVRRGLLRSNPARDVSTLTEHRTKGARGTALSAPQLRAFVAAIPVAVEREKIAADVGRQVLALSWSGMRIGEGVALRFEDVVEGEFRIERSVWRGHEKATKTDDPRRITVVAPVAEALEEQRRWLLTTQHPGLASGLVFPAAPQQARAGASRRAKAGHGDELLWYRSQSTVQEAIRQVCEIAEVPRITPHSLRRTFEDLSREAGVDKLVRRAVAGWSSEKAQGIYATVRREERDEAAGALIRLVLG